jgi:hypothetical protein
MDIVVVDVLDERAGACIRYHIVNNDIMNISSNAYKTLKFEPGTNTASLSWSKLGSATL